MEVVNLQTCRRIPGLPDAKFYHKGIYPQAQLKTVCNVRQVSDE